MTSRGDVHSQQVTVIEPLGGRIWPDLVACWRYRHLVGMVTLSHLRARYKQNLLGPFWIVLQPLMTMVVFTVLFGLVARLPSGGKPYAVFAFAALLPWNLFAGIVASSADCLVTSRALLEKVYFPRLVLPLARILSQLVDFSVNLLILAGMLVWFDQVPGPALWLLPGYVLLCTALGLGCGCLVAGAAARHRDMLQVVSFGTRLWMYATPVVYSAELVPQTWRPLLEWNPMTHVVEAFRRGFLGEGQALSAHSLIGCSLITLVVLVTGLHVFHRASATSVDIA